MKILITQRGGGGVVCVLGSVRLWNVPIDDMTVGGGGHSGVPSVVTEALHILK